MRRRTCSPRGTRSRRRMHELAVAQQIVRTVVETMKLRGAAAVRTIDVEVGALEGLRVETLKRAFALEAAGTTLEGVVLNVALAMPKTSCPACKAARQVDIPWRPDHAPPVLRCPECGSELEVEGGRGFVVQRAAMVLEDP